jgi:hypothetical protein
MRQMMPTSVPRPLDIPANMNPADLPAGWSYGADIRGLGWNGWYLVHESGAAVETRDRADLTTDDDAEDLAAILDDARLLHALYVAAAAEADAIGGNTWGMPEAAEARALTAELCKPWDFTSWSDAYHAARAGCLAGHVIEPAAIAAT